MLIALVIFGVLSTIFVTVIFVGVALPEHTVRAARIVLAATPERAWALIDDQPGAPAWRRDVRSVERLPDDDAGREVWREVHYRGPALTLTTLERTPVAPDHPGVLVRRLRLDKFGVEGRWEIEIAADAAGARVTVTEFARTESPFARFFGVFPGADRFLRMYLTFLAEALGEQPRFLAAPKPPYAPHASDPPRGAKRPVS